MFLDNRVKNNLTYNDGRKEKVVNKSHIDNINNVIIGLIIGLGFDYDLSKKFNLRFEPLFRYSLRPVAEGPVEQFNYSIGGQFGFLMKL
jgi:hypothetical protein